MTKHYGWLALSFIYEIPDPLVKKNFSETRSKNYDTATTDHLRKKLRKEIISEPQKYQKIIGYLFADKETEKIYN